VADDVEKLKILVTYQGAELELEYEDENENENEGPALDGMVTVAPPLSASSPQRTEPPSQVRTSPPTEPSSAPPTPTGPSRSAWPTMLRN